MYSARNDGRTPAAIGAAVLLVVLASVVLGTVRAAPPRPQSGGPCVGGVGQVTLQYTDASGAIVGCYYPQGQVPVGGTQCGISWLLPIPNGAYSILVTGIPVTWTFESAGPGNVVYDGAGTLTFADYVTSEQATTSFAEFELQMVGPCYVDPAITDLNLSLAALTARVAALQVQATDILGGLSGTNVTLGARLAGVQYFVTQGLQEENASYSYRLTVGVPLRLGDVYQFPVFVQLQNGELANESLTGQVCSGLSVTYLNASDSTALNWTTSACGTGRMEVSVTLTPHQISETTAGGSLVALSAPVKSGAFTNLAAGVIGSQQVTSATGPADWWSTIFGISTPPPAQNVTTVGDVLADLAWWGDSTAGRAIYALTSIVAILVYIHEAHKMARQRIAQQPRKSQGVSS